MLLSARAAARVLADVGVTRNQTARLLATGFAGPVTAAGGALLYDERRVRDLAARPQVDVLTLDEVCPGGVLTVRRDVDLSAPRSAQLDLVRTGWPFSLATMLVLRLRVQRHGSVALVAATAGFVSLGADLVAVSGSVSRRLAPSPSTSVSPSPDRGSRGSGTDGGGAVLAGDGH